MSDELSQFTPEHPPILDPAPCENGASSHRWFSTFILTSMACGLLCLAGPQGLNVMGAGAETLGIVSRDGVTVRYEIDGQQRTLSMRYHTFWGETVRVRYLRFAPSVSWCPDNDFNRFLLSPLLALYVCNVRSCPVDMAVVHEHRTARAEGVPESKGKSS